MMAEICHGDAVGAENSATCSLWLMPGWLWGLMGPYQGGLNTVLSWSREASTEWPGGVRLDGCHTLLQLRYQLWVGKNTVF